MYICSYVCAWQEGTAHYKSSIMHISVCMYVSRLSLTSFRCYYPQPSPNLPKRPLAASAPAIPHTHMSCDILCEFVEALHYICVGSFHLKYMRIDDLYTFLQLGEKG